MKKKIIFYILIISYLCLKQVSSIENKIIINKQDALKKNFIKTSQKLFKQQTTSSKKVIKL